MTDTTKMTAADSPERVAFRGTWIAIIDEGVPEGRKTHIYRVESAEENGAVILGTVKWYGAWRQYASFPCEQTLYEKTCLREIADFCESATVNRGAV